MMFPETWEVSASLIPYLAGFVAGRESWQNNETLRRSIPIDQGVVQDPKVLSFQSRKAEYPHEPSS